MNEEFLIRGELITLDALLKVLGWAESGGQAKILIAEGKILVDGEVETRKTRKLRGGEVVVYDGKAVTLKAAPQN